MSSRAGSRLLVLAFSASTVLAAPVAAHAGRAVTHDATADAVAITFTVAEDSSEEQVTAPAPEHASVDIVRTVVQHRTDRVRATVRLRDLVLRRRTFHYTAFRVVTPSVSYWVNVKDMPGAKAVASIERGSRTIECDGLRWSVDEDTDKVMVSVPTACVGTPRWVQVGVGVVEVGTESLTPEPEQVVMFVDDGHRDGSVAENSIAKGPKVFRG